jgi:pimeloyl-ACP methyl ester carboxylesterase
MPNSKRMIKNFSGIVCVAIVAMAAVSSSAVGQGKTRVKIKTKGKDVIEKTLTGRTGWPISIKYFGSTKNDAPAIILLHGKAGNQLIWEKTAETLRAKGFAVVTVDLRKHGKSIPEGAGASKKLNRTDYQLMVVEDLELVKQFLMDEHHAHKLNIRKLGIVAMGMSAPVALTFAGNDWLKKPYPDGPTLASRTPKGQDVHAIAMISPVSSVSGLTTTAPLKLLQTPEFNVAMLFVAGTADKRVKRDVEKMYKQVSTNKDNKKRMHMVARPDRANGAILLSDRFRKQTTDMLVRFFDENLTSLELPWRSRKSKLSN